MLIRAQTTSLALYTEDNTFSDHSLMECYSNIGFCPGKFTCGSIDGSYSVFRLCVATDLVVVETHNITIDIPSTDKSRNIFHEILRVSTPVRWTKRKMLSRNLKIFRFSTPHKEWPYTVIFWNQDFKTPNGKWVRVKRRWGIYILNFFKRDLFVFLSEK